MPSTCDKNRLTFQARFAIKQKTDVTDEGGGTSTALPGRGGPSNDGNNAETTRNDFAFHEYAQYVKYE
jgi:hypothetical protein